MTKNTDKELIKVMKAETKKCQRSKSYLYRKYGTDSKKYPSWLEVE